MQYDHLGGQSGRGVMEARFQRGPRLPAFHRREEGDLIVVVQRSGGFRAAAVDEEDRLDRRRDAQGGEQIGGRGPVGQRQIEAALAGRGMVAQVGEQTDVHFHAATRVLWFTVNGSKFGMFLNRELWTGQP